MSCCRGGDGSAGSERGRGGDGLGIQPIRRVGAAGVVDARAAVAAQPHVERRGRRAPAAGHASAHRTKGRAQRRPA